MSYFVGKFGKNPLILITDHGSIWDARSNRPVPDDEVVEHFDLRLDSECAQIGGGRIKRYWGRRVELRQHIEPDGRVWWDSVEPTQCTLKDIDEARAERARLANKPLPVVD